MTARRVASWFGAFAIGFAMTIVAAVATDASNDPPRGERLGGLELDRFCRATYGREASATLLTNAALSWQCAVLRRGLSLKPIDFDEACSANFGVDAYAETVEPHGPHDWQCYHA